MTAFAANRTAIALRRAAVRATLAPSIHNTQPWRLRLSGRALHLYADYSRQLQVLDPTGRQLTISVGCALFNARASLAADGLPVRVERLASPEDPALLASLVVDEPGNPVDTELSNFDHLIELRHSNRRQFADDAVPAAVLAGFEEQVAAEGAGLLVVHDPDMRGAVARLAQKADDLENLDPAYRAELRQWTTDDPGRTDGVPTSAVPHVSGATRDEIPIRDFDTRGSGLLPETASSQRQSLVLLHTQGDHPRDWLRAGEALERLLLEITRLGYVASPVTQPAEVPSIRAELRAELGMSGHPHVLLRLGRAAATPATRRRRLVDVLVEEA